MQEMQLYYALLGDLTDAQLAAVVASEFKRRGEMGIIFFVGENEKSAFVSVASPEILKYPAAQILRIFTKYAEGLEEARPEFDSDDDILSDQTPWVE